MSSGLEDTKSSANHQQNHSSDDSTDVFGANLGLDTRVPYHWLVKAIFCEFSMSMISFRKEKTLEFHLCIHKFGH